MLDDDRFAYYRLNDDYRPMHRLCRLFLEGASHSEDEGSVTFRTFLLDMSRLFEAFVTHVLRDRVPVGVRVDGQVPAYLGHEKKVRMQPDILVRDAAGALLAADCKYKLLGQDEFRHHDGYQLLAYCTAAAVEQGVLVYPVHEAPIRDEVQIRNTGIRVRQTSIDLGGSRDDLRTECDALARNVFAWSRV